METPTEAPKDIRHTIIERAQELFFTHGYTKVLMSELARQLGMSKKTLYLYFDGKEDQELPGRRATGN
jgi:AcrR family transcriptional regulator